MLMKQNQKYYIKLKNWRRELASNIARVMGLSDAIRIISLSPSLSSAFSPLVSLGQVLSTEWQRWPRSHRFAWGSQSEIPEEKWKQKQKRDALLSQHRYLPPTPPPKALSKLSFCQDLFLDQFDKQTFPCAQPHGGEVEILVLQLRQNHKKQWKSSIENKGWWNQLKINRISLNMAVIIVIF